jgi:hypothetical protein
MVAESRVGAQGFTAADRRIAWCHVSSGMRSHSGLCDNRFDVTKSLVESDIVLTKADGTFVTIMKGGATNAWFNGASGVS